MAEKKYLHDANFGTVSQIKNFRIHNATTAEINTLSGQLNANHEGMIVWNTDTQEYVFWTGSAWSQGLSKANKYQQHVFFETGTGTPTAPSNADSTQPYMVYMINGDLVTPYIWDPTA